MTIAILGGRFDPPHVGHSWVIEQVLNTRPDIDQVWVVPAHQHQWKATYASSHDRLAMTRFLAHERIRVSDMEIARGGISYSVDTVKAIKKKFNYTIYWIVGADIVTEFARWEKAQELSKVVTFLVFPRDPYQLPPTLPPGFVLLSNPDLVVSNLSSTTIRKWIGEGKSIHGFVPDGVEKYIKEHELYK